MKRIAFLFPGQGSQSIGMGKDFYESAPLCRELFEKAGERLAVDFKQLCFEDNSLLEQTEYTQPSILLVSFCALELFRKESSDSPVLALGHSLGEFGALSSVGALDVLDAVELVRLRGKAMQVASSGMEAGMMVLLGLDDQKAKDVCEAKQKEGLKVWCANFNQDGQIVIAGVKGDLKLSEKDFLEAGAKKAMLLQMSIASHCPLMAHAQESLKRELEKRLKDDFLAPVVSNVSALKYSTKKEAVELLAEQLVSPVLYKHSIRGIEDEVDCFVEFGGTVLKGLNKRITQKPTYSITDMKTLYETLSALKG